ncbi:S9 family peptidase [Halioglobus maricola]|uniref:S9 family peptidase n=1 Tax=Halioglobus maricola TaxID=2601894 RepID=UPI001F0D8F97|nr:S9 family peptidase [Halioglobus maricola]
MNTLPRLLAGAAALLLTLNAQASALSPLQPEDIFQLQQATSPVVDGSGKRIFYLRQSMDIMKDQRRTNVWMIGSDGEQHRPITSGAMNASSLTIAADDNRLAWVARDDAGAQIFMHWLDSGHSAQLTRLPASPGNLSFSPDGNWISFTMKVPAAPETMGTLPAAPKGAEWAPPPTVVDKPVFRSDGVGELRPGFTHVFLVSTEGGSVRQLTSGDYNFGSSLSWSKDSQALFLSTNLAEDWRYQPRESDIYRLDIASGELTSLTDRSGPDGSARVSPDGRALAYLGYDDTGLAADHNRLYVMDLASGESRQLLDDLDRGINAVRWSTNSKRLYISYDDKGDTVLASTDLSGRLKVITRDMASVAFGRPYSGGQFAVGGRDVIAYTVGAPYSPAELASGRGSEAGTQITHFNSNLLESRELGKVEEIWVESSADGLAIQGWIVKPPGFDPAKKYPLILEIHGGPSTAYGPHFSAEVQLYAAAGYVVLYANPRGSTSYGQAFVDEIHHNYPSKDYDDLMSAVDGVLAKGYVDEEQLYVTGGSGGGTLTAWIVGKTDRFRAAVVAKPVINWTSFVLTADNTPFFARYWFGEMPWENNEAYWKRSPLSLVGNVTTPTMLLTGQSDWRTPMWETEQYYSALKLSGVDTAIVRIPGASHSIARRPSQLLGKVAAILAWFERYSPEQQAAE